MALGLDEVRPQGLKSDFRGPALQRIVLSTFFALMLGTAPFRAHADATASTASHLDLPISGNPLLHAWTAPFNAPPFEQIDVMHFAPAVEEAIRRQQEDLQRIRSQSAKPSFSNTIEALELAGRDLRRIAPVFMNLYSANSTPELQKLGATLLPTLMSNQATLFVDSALFSRVKSLYLQRDILGLNDEQKRVLERYYTQFVRGGAGLEGAERARFKTNVDRLAQLAVQFNQNLLGETNRYVLFIADREELQGLPDDVIATAAETAKMRGKEGQWAFTLQTPSRLPFLTYARNRGLRETLFKAYVARGNNGNTADNNTIIRETVRLRTENAQLLGHPTFAHFTLTENMAKTPDNVERLLMQLWTPALDNAKRERDALQQVADAAGDNLQIAAWDWWYYSEKLRQQRYAIDESALKAYFPMPAVRAGAFDVAHRLWGLSFTPRNDVPVYHPDVEVFEVHNADGSHLGLLYTDYYVRDGKRPGAWASPYRLQSALDGITTPIIVNVCNFARPTGDTPSLLSFDDVSTLFHEFGHALHGLMSNVTYPSVGGTQVPRDFVEFPSQVMENWAAQREVLQRFARHYQSGEVISGEWLDKLDAAARFNQGFAATEYLSAALLDMRYHMLSEPGEIDPQAFEKKTMRELGLIDQIAPRYTSTNFGHVFGGGYASGYYAYIWAEVLDADGFQAFRQAGLFDSDTATRLRNEVFSRGGSVDPMAAYRRFRGSEPKVDALLEKRGLQPIIDDSGEAKGTVGNETS
jgi:peptidyl-dipeptidase Dcp